MGPHVNIHKRQQVHPNLHHSFDEAHRTAAHKRKCGCKYKHIHATTIFIRLMDHTSDTKHTQEKDRAGHEGSPDR